MDCNTNSISLPLKIGLLVVALSWFSFTLHAFLIATLYGASIQSQFWVLLTDTSGVLGLAFRTVAGFIAIIVILFYMFRKDLSSPEAMMSIRWILICEAIYWLSLLPSGVWGFLVPSFGSMPPFAFFIETGLPCMVGSILIPIALTKLFFELGRKKPVKNAIKWGLISGTAWIFVLWLENGSNWIYTIMEKGTEYISNYPFNLLSFIVTTVGLLVLALYAAYFSKKSFGTDDLSKLDLKRVGAITTALGLYFAGLYIMWIFLGSVGGWSAWYAWFLGHNMDLWILSLPLVGVPLLFTERNRTKS